MPVPNRLVQRFQKLQSKSICECREFVGSRSFRCWPSFPLFLFRLHSHFVSPLSNDWQFPPARLIELQNRETWAYQHSIGYKVPSREPKNGETIEQVQELRQAEQDKIAEAEPLTEEEEEEKEALAADQGFKNWTKRDYNSFIAASGKHGR